MGIFKKFQKGDITSGIRAWSWHLMVVTRIQINKPPPLDPEVEGVFVGGEEERQEENQPSPKKERMAVLSAVPLYHSIR